MSLQDVLTNNVHLISDTYHGQNVISFTSKHRIDKYFKNFDIGKLVLFTRLLAFIFVAVARWMGLSPPLYVSIGNTKIALHIQNKLPGIIDTFSVEKISPI